MRLLRWWTLLFCLVSRVIGGEFRTITGDVYVGEVSAADADGLIVRHQSGIFSPRVDWAKLDEATLKSLAGHPRAGRFVEPMLEPPAEDIARVCHPHPSLSEVMREAALATDQRALNM